MSTSTSAPFDVRVVNSLERPTINDFNMAQAAARTMTQALAQAIIDMPPYMLGSGAGGFIGTGFQAIPASGLTVKLSPGLGFQYSKTPEEHLNVDGITGVNVYDTVGSRPMVLGAGKLITLNPAPAAGMARRDTIAVRMRAVGTMTDAVASDTFNPASQVFTPTLQPKTFSWAYDNGIVDTLPAGGVTTATADFVYIPGIEYPYATPDDLLSYPLSTIPSDYRILAIINMTPELTTVTKGEICDYRQMVLPNRALSFPIQFEGGSEAGVPGGRMYDYNAPRLPGNMGTPILSRVGGGASNRYALHVLGYHNVKSMGASLSVGGPVFDGTTADVSFAAQATITDVKVPMNAVGSSLAVLTAAQVALLASTDSSPQTICAIGQPYSAINFALGYTDLALPGMNYAGTTWDSTGRATRIVNGVVTLSY